MLWPGLPNKRAKVQRGVVARRKAKTKLWVEAALTTFATWSSLRADLPAAPRPTARLEASAFRLRPKEFWR